MNVSEPFLLECDKQADKIALFDCKSKERLSFKQAKSRVYAIAHRLIELGVKPEDKVLVFLRPGLDFPLVTFALFHIGAIPILIDPGMGGQKFLKAIEEVKADVLIGIPKALILKLLFSRYFHSVRLTISNSSFLPHNFRKFTCFDIIEPYRSSKMAAILFTSGGTGRPKGVVYTHDIFIAQTQMLKKMFSLTAKDIDLAGFPLFALFTLSMGMTSCIPEMDPAKPSKANGKKLLENIKTTKATFVSGSPAIWKNLLEICEAFDSQLESVNYLVMFGAPVALDMHERFAKYLPNGTTYTPYGATESLPVSLISGNEILSIFKERILKGEGICIGKPVDDVRVKIVGTDSGGTLLSDIVECEPYEIGEILVQSQAVTKEYYGLPEQSKLAKVYDGEKIWHRMGDNGYIDDQGFIWFCGRVAHQVKVADKVYYPIPIESPINLVRGVDRCALISYKENLALVICPEKGAKESFILSSIKPLISSYPIQKVLFKSELPVDTRHNIKIDRKALKVWALQQ